MRSRHDALVAWRSQASVAVSDRELFHFAVFGEVGPRWPAAVTPPRL
jgi:hypothetical protein